MVAVGGGVSVAGAGVLVARNASMAVQDVNNVIARRANARRHMRRSAVSNLDASLEIASGEEQKRPRNDIK